MVLSSPLDSRSGVQELPGGLNGSRQHRAHVFPPPFPNGWYRIAGSSDIESGNYES